MDNYRRQKAFFDGPAFLERIAVLDYGLSNLRSVAKALEHVASPNQRIELCTQPEQLGSVDRLVFPGQGAIGNCMERLAGLGLDTAIREHVANKPYLGLCLGLQSLLSASEEDGGTPGLDLIAGSVVRFAPGLSDPDSAARLKIPHMGWNRVLQDKPHPLWAGIADGARFYFVHSYYVVPDDAGLSAAHCDYGIRFCCAITQGNVFAVQFHPEKSQSNGLRLLANFLTWKPT
jgi:glutamine amidotransferase